MIDNRQFILSGTQCKMRGVMVLVLALFSTQGMAQCPAMQASYEVQVDGDLVGSMSIERQQQDQTLLLVSRTYLQVPSWGGDYDVRSVTAEEHQASLVKADTRTIEDGKTIWKRVSRETDEYWLSASRVATASEAEEQALVDATSGVLTGMVPGLGDALTILSLFSEPARPSSSGMRISEGDIDSSLLYLPCYWLTVKQQLPDELRLLDSEEIYLRHMQLQQSNEQDMTVQGQQLATRYYRYQNKQGENLEIWLGQTPQGPAIVQLKGEEDDTPYLIKLKEWGTSAPAL
ncbi:hypothetical protein [Bowmanella denitrificans]|uniref:hypothetical protein n=1 Tax=Bowmanella denitrificans TaxID=366582 RepID=UPI000C9C828C|nr:hypothetical protein [Bowmanella denitrificans]